MSRSNAISFLHPVLRDANDDYIDGSVFQANYSVELLNSDSQDTCKLNYTFNLSNPYLMQMLKERKIAIQIDCYCGETLFHELIHCDTLAGEHIFAAGAINGRLEIQGMLVALSNIVDFEPKVINNEFTATKFNLEMGSLVAFESGATFEILNEFVSFRDIIRVQTSEELDTNEYSITLQSNVITINMGLNVRKAFEIMKSDVAQKPHLFASIYKDTFVEALMALPQREFEEFAWANRLREQLKLLKLGVNDMKEYTKANSAALLILGKKSYSKLVKDDI